MIRSGNNIKNFFIWIYYGLQNKIDIEKLVELNKQYIVYDIDYYKFPPVYIYISKIYYYPSKQFPVKIIYEMRYIENEKTFGTTDNKDFLRPGRSQKL